MKIWLIATLIAVVAILTFGGLFLTKNLAKAKNKITTNAISTSTIGCGCPSDCACGCQGKCTADSNCGCLSSSGQGSCSAANSGRCGCSK